MLTPTQRLSAPSAAQDDLVRRSIRFGSRVSTFDLEDAESVLNSQEHFEGCKGKVWLSCTLVAISRNELCKEWFHVAEVDSVSTYLVPAASLLMTEDGLETYQGAHANQRILVS